MRREPLSVKHQKTTSHSGTPGRGQHGNHKDHAEAGKLSHSQAGTTGGTVSPGSLHNVHKGWEVNGGMHSAMELNEMDDEL